MTALQELEDYLMIDGEINENLQVHDILIKVNALLEKEKQQIVDAFNIADNNYPHGNGYDNGNDYYKQKYL